MNTELNRWSDVGRTSAAIWAEHRLLLFIAFVYVAAGGAWLWLQHQPWHFHLAYQRPWILWLILTSGWVILTYMLHPRLVKPIFRPERVLGALLVASLVAPVQSTFQSLKRGIPAFLWDDWLSRIDVALHRVPPWTLWLPGEPVMRFIDFTYIRGWFMSVGMFVVWLSWTSRRELRTRALVSTILVWILGGSVLAWAFSSAGPCYYDRIVAGDNPYSALTARIEAQKLFAGDAQRVLWGLRTDGIVTPTSGISAMPSMHVTMGVLMAIVMWHRSRAIGLILALYAGLVQIGSVVLGWHYAIDGYVGAGVAAFCWWGAGWLCHGEKHPRQSAQAESITESSLPGPSKGRVMRSLVKTPPATDTLVDKV